MQNVQILRKIVKYWYTWKILKALWFYT